MAIQASEHSSIVSKAGASMPSRTPADGGFVHARTINTGHTRSAYNVDLRDPCRLMNWNRRHGLRRHCERYGKGKSDPLGHWLFLQRERFKNDFLETAQTPPPRISSRITPLFTIHPTAHEADRPTRVNAKSTKLDLDATKRPDA